MRCRLTSSRPSDFRVGGAAPNGPMGGRIALRRPAHGAAVRFPHDGRSRSHRPACSQRLCTFGTGRCSRPAPCSTDGPTRRAPPPSWSPACTSGDARRRRCWRAPRRRGTRRECPTLGAGWRRRTATRCPCPRRRFRSRRCRPRWRWWSWRSTWTRRSVPRAPRSGSGCVAATSHPAAWRRTAPALRRPTPPRSGRCRHIAPAGRPTAPEDAASPSRRGSVAPLPSRQGCLPDRRKSDLAHVPFQGSGARDYVAVLQVAGIQLAMVQHYCRQ